MDAQQKAIARQIEANFPNTECFAVGDRLHIESYKEVGYVENGVFVATTKLSEKVVAEFQKIINEVLEAIEQIEYEVFLTEVVPTLQIEVETVELNTTVEEAMVEMEQYFEDQEKAKVETAKFEVGKKYDSVYNSGEITVTARTAKFIQFTEEINGKARTHTIITIQGIIETEGKIVERKKVKELNGTEYIANGICTYYAKNEVTETTENKGDLVQEALKQESKEVEEAKEMIEVFYQGSQAKFNYMDIIEAKFNYIDILEGNCKSDIEIPKLTTEKIIAMCEDVKVIEKIECQSYQGKVWEYVSYRLELGEEIYRCKTKEKAFNQFIKECQEKNILRKCKTNTKPIKFRGLQKIA
jgi:hypothetical protein